MKFTTIFTIAAFTVSVLYTQRAEKQQFLSAPSEGQRTVSNNATLDNSTQINYTSGNSTSDNSTQGAYKFAPKRAAVQSRQAIIAPADNTTINNATIVNKTAPVETVAPATNATINNATIVNSTALAETVAPATNTTINNATIVNSTAVPASSNNTQNVTQPGWNKFVSGANDSLRNVTSQISDFFHGGVKSTDNNTPLGGKN